MKSGIKVLERGIGRPIANASFVMMQHYIRSMQKNGVGMMHTARSFDSYRKVFYRNRPRSTVLSQLQDKRIVDVGCGYTPYAGDSMFRACHQAGIEFYGVDPLVSDDIHFGFKERILARATGGRGDFRTDPPGIERALCATAQALPFEEQSVDEILCSYLLFVWIEDEETLADIFEEFQRVLKPGGVVKLFPLHEWQWLHFDSSRLNTLLQDFRINQTFILGGPISRVMSSMLTEMTLD